MNEQNSDCGDIKQEIISAFHLIAKLTLERPVSLQHPSC
uniref:Uncharacterized protein n=1 Tax=Anguilla anguilla TaxID=7936 RepID=A0A0E9RJB1_ANGAN